MGACDTDLCLVYFSLVAGTCPTNSSHGAFRGTSRRLVPGIQTRLNSVGLVAGTKFWSLRLDFVAKMASSHDAISPCGLL